MRTFAVLPVKRFGAAKQRLAEGLEPAGREALAEAMVRDVLAALARVEGLDGVVVVTNEPRAAAAASGGAAVTAASGAAAAASGGPAAAEVVADAAEAGQSAAAEIGMERARERGAERVLLVPGDCPALDAGEVSTLLAEGAPPPSVTLVPDRHGTGTNALLLAPPGAIAPSFGEGSFARHRDAAGRAGAALTVARPPSLLLDVDTAGDLAALREALAASPDPPRHTTAALTALAAP